MLRISIYILIIVATVAAITGPFIFKAFSSPINRITNTGKSDLTDIECVYRANSRTGIKKVKNLKAGQSVDLSERTSDFYVEEISFKLRGNVLKSPVVSIATPGEIYVFEIDDAGNVKDVGYLSFFDE